MNPDARLDRLVATWKQRHDRGETVSAASLCRDCPELVPLLRKRIEALRSRGDPVRPTLDGPRTSTTADDEKPTQPQFAPREGIPSLPLDPPGGPDELGRLGPYRVLRVLGQGGMGMVLEAHDVRLGRRVAMKVLRPELSASGVARQRFLREARVIAALDHDHVVPVYEADQINGVCYLTMPLLEGETLEEKVRRDGPLPVPDVLRVCREIAEGLAAAHAAGVIHRDVKPANTWLDAKRRRVRLLDFGLARANDGSDLLTQSGALLGTPAFMAPEQARGAELDPRCDLFSLGSVLYYVSTARQPFHGPDVISTLTSVCNDHPPRAPVAAALPGPVLAILDRLHRKDPAERPASAADVVRMIERVEQAMGARADKDRPAEVGPAPRKPEPKPAPSRPRSRFPVLLVATVAAGALLAAGLGLGGWLLWRPPAFPEKVAVTNKEGPAPGEPKPDDKPGPALPARLQVAVLRGHTKGIKGLAFSPKGDRLATAGADYTVRLWSVPAGAVEHVIPPKKNATYNTSVNGVAFSPGGERVAAGSGDQMVKVWDVATEHEELSLDHPSVVNAVAWSPDGQTLAAGSYAPTFTWDLKTGKQTHELKGHQNAVNGVLFSPDGRTLYTGSADGTVKVWDWEAEKPRLADLRHGQRVHRMALSRDGSRLATVGEGNVRVWDTATGKQVQELAEKAQFTGAVAFSPDGTLLATGSGMVQQPGVVELWRLDRKEVVATLRGHEDHVTDLAFSPSGELLASASWDSRVVLWNVAVALAGQE